MGKQIRALVVEDDPSWQEILGEILSDFGLLVDRAKNMEDAVRLVRSQAHRVAVLDLSLGGSDHRNQDGLQVLESVRRYDPGCASLVLTGYATVDLAVSLIRDKGAFTCLQKETFRRAEFRKVVNQALAAATAEPGSKETGDRGLEGTPELAGSGRERAHPVGTRPFALIVEDDAGWRSLLSELLTDAGFQAQQSVSYVEALGLLHNQAYELAVIDLSLASSLEPENNQDGYRLLATTQKAAIPTVIVSGYADPSAIEHAYADYQLFACMEKQAFDRRQFLQTVQNARQSGQTASELQSLTAREREVLALLGQGFKNKEIADKLFITPNTVKRHLKSLFAKLGINTRAAASAIAARHR